MADEGLYAGCARTADGLVFWEQAARGEDPGVVYAMASKAATDVLFFYLDPEITGDPRELDLPVSVQDMPRRRRRPSPGRHDLGRGGRGGRTHQLLAGPGELSAADRLPWNCSSRPITR